MKLLLLLHHAAPDHTALAQYFSALGDAGAVLAAERVSADGAAVSITGDARTAPITISRDLSGLSALWLVDAPSKQAAVDIARGIPGAAGDVDVYEYFGGDMPPVAAPAGTQRYLTMVRADAQSESGAQPSPAVMDEMGGYITELVKTHPMIGGGGLSPSSRAVRLRRSADARNVIDGPFAEAKELVAGYGIIAARSLDDAIDAIRPWLRIHHAHTPAPVSTLEVRPLL